MKTICAEATARVAREPLPALQAVPVARAPESDAETLAQRIQRLVAEANAMVVVPAALQALNPAHPASETFLNLCAPERTIAPPARR